MDTNSDRVKTLRGPFDSAMPVVPSDTELLPVVSGAVYAGGLGSLRVEMLSGEVVTLHSIAHITAPIRVRRVFETGTTADNIFVFY